MQTNFTDINKLAEGYVINNYNSLFLGNGKLENALHHSFNLNYIQMNAFNFYELFGQVGYSKSIKAIKSRLEFF